MAAIKNVFAFLFLLCAGALGSSPTSAPTSQPSAAPTSAPTSPIETTTVKPTETPKPTTTKKSNVTTIEPSKAKKTTFTTKLTVASASDFDEAKYLESLVEATGLPAGNVKIASIDFVIAVTYKFAEGLTVAQIAAGAASMAGVNTSAVEVTIKSRRRLRALEAERRLAETEAEVKITAQNASAADLISTAANDTSKIVAGMAATGVTVVAPTVTAAPATQVVVVTELVSTDTKAVAPPGNKALKDLLEAKTGKTFTVDVGAPSYTGGEDDNTTTVAATTTAAGPGGGESGDAQMQAVQGGLFGALVLAMGHALLFGM